MKSQDLIQQLLKAEKQADQLIQKARENRVAKLKEAKSSADMELDAFRKKEEEKFNTEYASLGGKEGDVAGDLAKTTQRELQMVQQDYNSNKDKIREHILGKVLEVPLELSPAFQMAIKRGAL